MAVNLNRVIQELMAAKDLPEVLNYLTDYTMSSLTADACAIFLTDMSLGEHVLSAVVGFDQHQVGKFKLKLDQGIIGQVVEREELVNTDNCQTHKHYQPSDVLLDEQFYGFLAVPIIHQGDGIGVIVLYATAASFFDEDAEAFLTTLSAQVSEEIAQAIARGAIAQLTKGPKRKKREVVLFGLSGAEGVAIGKAVLIYPPADLDAVPDQETDDVDGDIALFKEALEAAREEINLLQVRARATLSIAESALFDAYLRILDSRSLMNEIEDDIKQGLWVQAALRHVINRHALRFESLNDDYLKERASDFRDLGRRILAHLQANKREEIEYPKQMILVSDEVTPTMLMEIPEGQLVGIISGSGSSNSHVAILARALGIPTIMGVTGTPITELSGCELIVDGYNGQVYLSPSATLKKEFRQIALEEKQFDDELLVLRDKPAVTVDGHQINLLVNTGLVSEGGLCFSVGAEGVGLYRTELAFMARDRFPTEDEQRTMYRQLLNTFSPKPVVMRTLDVGGDKPLPYFSIEEDNPFLGWRGIRVTLDHPELFLPQVRAMIAASEGLNNLSILLPMITSISEIEASQRLIQQAYDELISEGLDVEMPPVGIMIEVPAAVYQATEFAKRVDFVSIGTNDLIQYLLAVDRNNPRVANIYDCFHPAVIRALHQAVKGAHKAGKPISVCGELAADPIMAILLLGMGFDSLSMSARSLLRIKWAIRHVSFAKSEALVKEILKLDDSIEIRVHLEMALESAGLGGLIRAGKS